MICGHVTCPFCHCNIYSKLISSRNNNFFCLGSEWVLEDTIYLKNIHLPRLQIDPSLDLSYFNSQSFLSKKQRLQSHFIKAISSEDLDSRSQGRNGDHHYNGVSDNNIVKTGTISSRS